MNWKDTKEQLTKDWTIRQKIWYKLTYFIEGKWLEFQLWRKK